MVVPVVINPGFGRTHQHQSQHVYGFGGQFLKFENRYLLSWPSQVPGTDDRRIWRPEWQQYVLCHFQQFSSFARHWIVEGDNKISFCCGIKTLENDLPVCE